MASTPTDRNLLFGLMALQMGFVDRETMTTAMLSWLADREGTLEERLRQNDLLSLEDSAAIQHAVRRHLEKRDDDAARCLTELDFALHDSVKAALESAADYELRLSLTRIGSGASAHADRRSEDTTVWSDGAQRHASGHEPSLTHESNGRPRYRKLRLHARGGLGEVHIAWDEELGRRVALKEMRPEYARNPGLRLRFEREAEVNGNLEHPGIVPVHGMGRHEDGRPYYAMRFVEGETVQAAIERFQEETKNLSASAWSSTIRPLLRRFLVVCEAIHYAHSRGVLHRDLKPSNIMLGSYEETLIIDWGLARVMGQAEVQLEGMHEESQATGHGPVPMPPSGTGPIPTYAGETLGSPPYMSPEQARGEHDDLTAATDIYALGATLFCILTGRPPVSGSKSKEVLAKVVNGEICKATSVDSRVPSALEAICLKAMALSPADRYGTARELANDLEQWLADQPVSVYRDPISTRIIRWAKRRKSWVAATLALLLTTMVGLSIATLVFGEQKRRAELDRAQAILAMQEAQKARQEAVKAQDQARAHLKIGLDAFEELVTAGDRQLISQASLDRRARFLDSAVNFIRQFREREPDNVDLQIRTASVARRTANLYRLTGRFDEADVFYEESLAIYRGLHAKNPDQPTVADRLAEVHLDRGDAWMRSGRVAEAELEYTRAVALCRMNRGSSPASTAYQRTLARSLSGLSSSRLRRGQPEPVEPIKEAVSLIEPIADASRSDVRTLLEQGRNTPFFDQIELADELVRLAEACNAAGDPAARDSALSRAHRVLEEVAGALQPLGVSVQKGLPVGPLGEVQLLDIHDFGLPDLEFARAVVDLRRNQLQGDQIHAQERIMVLQEILPRLRVLATENSDVVWYQTALAEALLALGELQPQSEEPSASQPLTEAFLILEDLAIRFPRIQEVWADRSRTLEALSHRIEPDAERASELHRVFLEEALRSIDRALALNAENPTFQAQRQALLQQRKAWLEPDC